MMGVVHWQLSLGYLSVCLDLHLPLNLKDSGCHSNSVDASQIDQSSSLRTYYQQSLVVIATRSLKSLSLVQAKASYSPLIQFQYHLVVSLAAFAVDLHR